MAMIRINHRVLEEMADVIDTYCGEQNKEMRSAESAVKSMLSSDWIGKDANEFNNKWEQVNASDSVTVKFRDSLSSFGEALRACAKEYRTAQEDSYDEASRLPK